MATHSQISEAEWQQHKDTIYQLYIAKNTTLAQVMAEMATKFNFHATSVLTLI
jgi:hypothetical protein